MGYKRSEKYCKYGGICISIAIAPQLVSHNPNGGSHSPYLRQAVGAYNAMYQQSMRDARQTLPAPDSTHSSLSSSESFSSLLISRRNVASRDELYRLIRDIICNHESNVLDFSHEMRIATDYAITYSMPTPLDYMNIAHNTTALLQCLNIYEKYNLRIRALVRYQGIITALKYNQKHFFLLLPFCGDTVKVALHYQIPTPLHYAAYHNNADALRELIHKTEYVFEALTRKYGFPDHPPHQKMTPYEWAAFRGSKACKEILDTYTTTQTTQQK